MIMMFATLGLFFELSFNFIVSIFAGTSTDRDTVTISLEKEPLPSAPLSKIFFQLKKIL